MWSVPQKGTPLMCEECAYYVYDEEEEIYYCDMDLDEDEMYRFMTATVRSCPYYQNGDEYRVVLHQM